jgi:hypothetical protein
MVVVIHSQCSSRNPPLEQLLEGMDSGGVSSVVIVESPPHPPPPTLQADACSSGVVVRLTVVVVHCQHSSCNPPLEQLLEGMDSGGVSSAVVVESPPIHPHPPCKQTLAAAEWWCSSRLSSAFLPQSTPRAVARGHGFGWCHPRSLSKGSSSTCVHVRVRERHHFVLPHLHTCQ